MADVKTRLTRKESRARTRAAVVDAAAAVFARRGFAAATMEEIAAEAGFTRGAVYSNFEDKADLFLAVLDDRMEARAAQVRAVFAGAGNPAGFLADLAAANAERDRDDLWTWELLRLEFRLYAARNPEVRPRLAEHNRRLLGWVAEATAAIFRQSGIEPPRPIDDVAAVVQGLDEGLSLLRLADPDSVRPDLYLDVLGFLLEAAAALDRERR